MALTKQGKKEVIDEVAELLGSSKLTVVAKYQGTTVKALQGLRREAKDNGTKVKVVKNRLVIQALQANEGLKSADTSELTGMLLYAFNAEDEVAPAQVLASFAKKYPTLQFVGGITSDGQFIGSDDVKALASLPSKDQLRGILVGTIAAPLSGFVNVLSGNVRGVLNVLNARAEALGN
jgi:large subunit ribosomal protein L10